MALNSTLLRQFIGFIGIGVIATAVQYAVLVTAVEWLGMKPVSGSTVGYFLSAIVNYLLNYRFNFRSRNSHVITASRFAIVAALGLLLNGAVLLLATHLLGAPYLIAQLVATAIVLGWNFAGNALWSFTLDRHQT